MFGQVLQGALGRLVGDPGDGLAGGHGVDAEAVAIVFQFALISTDRVARGIPMPLWVRPVIGGLAVGTIGVFLPEILGVGYAATDDVSTGVEQA